MGKMNLFQQAMLRPWRVVAISGLLLLLSAVSCENIPEYPVSGIEVFAYNQGETLVYESGEGNLQYLIVDQVKREFRDDSNTDRSTNAYRYEHQEVHMHFLHDEPLIATHDSLYRLWQECYPVNGRAACDLEYDYGFYDRGIELIVTGEPVQNGRRSFKWKKLTFTDQSSEFRHLSDFQINGTPYDYVLKFTPNPGTIDSILFVRTVYFSFKHGILKYENQDGEVFQFLEKR